MHPGRQVVAGPDRRALAGPAELARADPARADASRRSTEIVADYARAAELARGGRVRLRRGPRRARLPAVELPLAARQPARRRVRRQRWRTARASASRSRGDRRGRAGLPLVWRINGDDGIEGGFDARRVASQVSRRLEEAGVGRDQRLGGHVAHAARHARADVRPARAHAPHGRRRQARRERPGDRRRPARRPRARRRVVADGDADLVLLGRALIAEPDWPRKVEEGRLGELRPCIACNACVDLGRPRRARPLLGQPGGGTRARRGRSSPRPRRGA